MSIDAFLKWLQNSSLAETIRQSLYLFPFLESAHVVGLALVFGTIVVLDLRLMGFASTRRPFKHVESDILRWTWMAFALTAATGSLMFTTNAGVYYHNFYFRMKMILLMLAGLNMFVFELTLGRKVHDWDRASAAPPFGRLVGALSIVIWVGVIFAGRFIGFTTTRAAAVAPPPANVNFDDFLNSGPPSNDAGK